MAVSKGSFGRIRVFEDFGAPDTGLTWGTAAQRLGLIGQVSVNEGSFAHTVDEPGGILAITTDTGDNDNIALYFGPFKPSDGGCVIEARFKQNDVTLGAIFCGFTETLDATTPVCPAEYATATLTVNGTGGVVGMLYDPDATTDRWLAVAGDGGAAATGAPAEAGSQAMVNDEFDVVRVEIDPNGTGRCYLAEKDGSLKLIKTFTTPVNPADIQHAVLLIENRSGAARVMEVDYFHAEGGRDWTR